MIRAPHWERPEIWALDPVTLGVGLLTALGGGLASKLAGGNSAPAPLPSTPPPAQSPTGSASTNKPLSAPSFLSAAAAPQQGNTSGAKTLLGV